MKLYFVQTVFPNEDGTTRTEHHSTIVAKSDKLAIEQFDNIKNNEYLILRSFYSAIVCYGFYAEQLYVKRKYTRRK